MSDAVIVTGSDSGIGRATAVALARTGHRVGVTWHTDAAGADETARLVREYVHPRRLLSPFMGNAQVLPNGNVVVGWGGLPYVTEFREGGGVHFDARLPRGGQNYRAFRLPWIGRPDRPPRMVSAGPRGRRRLYVSWNGATQVAEWRLEVGTTLNDLRVVARKPKRSFETSFPVPGNEGIAVIAAVNARGRVLARTREIRL